MASTINWDAEKVLYETLRLGLEEDSLTQEAYQAIFEEVRKHSGGDDHILVPFEQLVEQYHPEWFDDPGSQGMTRLQTLEQQVRDLSAEELAEFRQWFAEFDAQVWDRQFEADVKTCKLGKLGEKALREYAEGRTKKRMKNVLPETENGS